MNCRDTRKLISPYLDHQLTGREMLAMQDHFRSCSSCAEEMHSILQVKRLLRGLHASGPQRDLSGAIDRRLMEAEMQAKGWRILSLPPNLISSPFPLSSFSHPAARPPRGRRLVTALGLSCLTILSIAAPFAPASRDGARMTSGFLSPAFLMPSTPAPTLAPLPGSEITNPEILSQTPDQIAPTQEMNLTVVSFSTMPARNDLPVFPVTMPTAASPLARPLAVPPADYSR